MSRNGNATNWREAEEVQRGVFRDVNERIVALCSHFAALYPQTTAQLVCECADFTCTEEISVTLADYDDIRAGPRRYLIAPNHEDPERETVIAAGDGYVVVETLAGTTSKIAETTDPRRRARLASLRRERARDESRGAA